MQIKRAVFILLSAAALATTKPAKGTGNAACKTPCACNARLHKILAHYEQQVNAAQANLNTNQRNFMKLQIATLFGNLDFQKKAAPVIAAAGDVIQRCQKAIATDRPKLLAAQLAGAELSKAYHLQHQLEKAATKLVLTADGSTQFTASSFTTHTLGATPKTECTKSDGDDAGVAVTASNAKEEKPMPAFTLTAKLAAKCDRGGSNTCHSSGFTNNGVITLDLTHTRGTVTETKNQWNSDTQTTPAEIGNPTDLLHDNMTNSNAKLDALKTLTAPAECSKMLRTYTTISGEDKFNKIAIKTLLNKVDNEKTTTTPPSALDIALKEAYGQDGTTYEDNIWSKVDKQDVGIGGEGKETKKDLGAIDDLNELSDALARWMARTADKSSKQQNEDLGAKKDDDQGCNRLTDKTKEECKNLGCDYDTENKKCKAITGKDNAAAGKGEEDKATEGAA
uniref:Variant surface glycoprotein 1125.1444 n=1 Tax=Trypanosoma brucei TaxID=5691 RepID=A0A1J0R709_9TRYP|nr:variant surface glycoprotein 1125.1444 [Trypanosoma brucei]